MSRPQPVAFRLQETCTEELPEVADGGREVGHLDGKRTALLDGIRDAASLVRGELDGFPVQEHQFILPDPGDDVGVDERAVVQFHELSHFRLLLELFNKYYQRSSFSDAKE